MAIKLDPNAAATTADAYNLKKIQAKSDSEEKLTYTDANGRAFNLSVKNTVDVNYAVYDRQSLLKAGTGGADQATGKAGTADGAGQSGGDTTIEKIAQQFRSELLAQLFNAFSGATDGTTAPAGGKVALPDRVEILNIDQTTTISMDNVDTEYWSVENTAGRLVDFAKSLYAGGDRGEHLQKMLAGLEQGFNAAKEAFGGTLPDISQKTIDLARKMLTDWASGGNSQAGAQGAVDLTA